MIDFGLTLTYLLISVATLICVASPILQIKNDASKLKKMIIPVIGLCLIIGLSILHLVYHLLLEKYRVHLIELIHLISRVFVSSGLFLTTKIG